MRHRPGHGTKLSYYEFGATALFACQEDQRFSYCLYVPRSYDEDQVKRYPMVVVVHGTERGAQEIRDAFVDFAESRQCVVLAPLFPGGIGRPGELDNYKFMVYEGIRFDRVLLAMVAEVANRYRIGAEKFLLHGFSGGGHFAHRFLYLHPDRLTAVSIGAPGLVTLLDDTKPWWVGTGNVAAKFGIEIDLAAIRRVKVQLVVGAEDTETWEITTPKTSPRWMPNIEDTGRTRIERLRSLHRCFSAQGMDVCFDLVPGVAHSGSHPALLARVQEFFGHYLEEPSS